METGFISMAFGLLLIALGAGWVFGTQRMFVSLDERCKNAISQIGVQQNSRWDGLTALVDLIRSYSEHEYNSLMQIIGARTRISPSSSAQDVQQQEDSLGHVMGRLLAVAESYPELKASQLYVSTMSQTKEYENDVRMARMVYNDTVTRYNEKVRAIPSSIVASMFGFDTREYLQEPAGKTEMPNMKI